MKPLKQQLSVYYSFGFASEEERMTEYFWQNVVDKDFNLKLKNDISGCNPEREFGKYLLIELGADIDLSSLWSATFSGIVKNRNDRKREFIRGKRIIGLNCRREKAISLESMGMESCRETIKSKHSDRGCSCKFY